jgi:arylsulfatase A-like enzyme
MSPHIPYDPAPDAREAVRAHPTRIVPETPPPGAGCYRPGTPVDDARRAELVALYDAAVRDADRAVGALLDALDATGRAGRTVVVVTADHGEEFYEHRGWSHGQSLHEELLRVPLLVRVPGTPARRVGAPVMSVDVMPTVLAAAGLRPGPALAGRDLGPLLRGDALASRPVFAEIVSPRCRSEAVVADGWKQLVWSREDASGEATYHLAADPAEARPVADPMAGATLRALRDAHRATAVARVAPVGEHTGIAAEQRDRLRALGYLGDD